MISKEALMKNFSFSALHYNEHAFIQRRIAGELIGQIKSGIKDPRFILDIGIGTGYVAGGLRQHYPRAKITGLDIAFGMLNKARLTGPAHLVQADAEYLPFKSGIFDLVASNLAYQWLINLDNAFCQARELLVKGGSLYFSLFGRDTLSELIDCLRMVKNVAGIKAMPYKDEIYRKLTKAGFSNIEVTSKIEQELFVDVWDILRWLKILGVNRRGVNFSGLEARSALRKVNQLYVNNFCHNEKVIASFEKILVKAVKR